ncbi:leucyl aminopeptidase family protein [Rhizobiales bacterium RZME27]|uniref:Leucyl aminopeptidase family protein n=1 Tax=Endobacterium cereale TaxID=2663029 RepID=A0A6A8A5J0_9HYPH|nr:leucyl aminopeptidase family protein [Endobacterium cereale]MEB2844948.1 leucyl aminopeptidase family protein [Endobacterium cereale]MQY44860.1 leucyl aminopeptidase family protein [Endobacterium cereale]
MSPYQFTDRPSPFVAKTAASRPVYAVTPADLEAGSLPTEASNWARSAGFKAESGAFLLVPGASGELASALFGLGSEPADAPYATGKLARSLPAGEWYIESSALAAEKLAFGFGLGSYSFNRYLKDKPQEAKLALGQDVDAADLDRQLAAVFLARDLINTPTNDMGPENLEAAFRALGKHYDAEVSAIVGEDLLARNFPLIHTVGRASAQAPRLLEMRWGRKGAKTITLVGKGVCFDTGGLDIKPAASMLLMKKDMGGAANVLALALMIMDAGLDVDLHVLVPAVENSISANAFRPSDIYRSRKGITVQIDNTDAEGRLVLADALAYADEDAPDLMIDMATLTGAARVALGPDLPPFFTDDEALASALPAASAQADDPIWRLPLFKGYEKDIRSRAAEITNAPGGGMAGAITAALFLKRFVSQAKSWAHFDIYGWCPAERPHAPVGGEAQAIRALYTHIREIATKA